MRATAVVIPVPVMEPIVLPRLRRSLSCHVLSGPAEVNAHVTLIGPFAEPTPALLEELAEFFARYPAHPPYGGWQTEIRPHLTVEYQLDLTTLESIEAEMERVSPVPAMAELACLNLYESLGSRVVASFPFRPARFEIV